MKDITPGLPARKTQLCYPHAHAFSCSTEKMIILLFQNSFELFMACIFVVLCGLKGPGFQQEVTWVTLHGNRLHAREQRSKSIIALYFQAYYFWQFTLPEGAKIFASQKE